MKKNYKTVEARNKHFSQLRKIRWSHAHMLLSDLQNEGKMSHANTFINLRSTQYKTINTVPFLLPPLTELNLLD